MGFLLKKICHSNLLVDHTASTELTNKVWKCSHSNDTNLPWLTPPLPTITELLTHWDKMADILQTFTNQFSCENIVVSLYLIFTEICSQGSSQLLASTGWDNGLVPNRCQAIIWTNDGSVYFIIYVLLSTDEFRCHDMNTFHITDLLCRESTSLTGGLPAKSASNIKV